MLKKTRLHLYSLLLCALTVPMLAHAQEAKPLDARDKYIYEKPSYAKFSQLYWALDKFDAQDNRVIDNFMRINECEIYTNYINNEFEWNSIRDSGRQYILSNVEEFSTRFEIEQPLRLSEYDFTQQTFEIWDPYKVDGIKLFEILSPEFDQGVCGLRREYEVPQYPKGIILELPRPVSLLSIKMSPKVARSFVKMKGSTGARAKDKEEIYKARDAYLVMKIKFFSLKGDQPDSEDGRMRTKALAALESLEVYADRKRKVLLYSEVFRQRTGRTTAQDTMRARFEKRKAKREAEKAKKAAEEAAAKAAEEAAAPAE
jgi:hypothetical protein